MRVLIAPDKFAGTMTASEVGEAIERGWRSRYESDEIRVVPMADGGPGSVLAVATALGATVRFIRTTDQRGGPVRAPMVAVDERTALIEAASACGLELVPKFERAPMNYDTGGVGNLLREVASMGYERVMIGLGGTGTIDCGVGAALALGAVIENAAGERFASLPPSRFQEIHRVEGLRALSFDVVAVTDVTNPLLGANGAARVFGPQKGATPVEVEALELALMHVADVVESALPGGPWRDIPGAGAAGGLGFGLMAWTGASVRRGSRLIGELVGLREHIKWSQFVVTGEGSIDSQSLAGKAPFEVLSAAAELEKPFAVVAGRVTRDMQNRVGLAEVLGRDGLMDPTGAAARAGARLAVRAHMHLDQER